MINRGIVTARDGAQRLLVHEREEENRGNMSMRYSRPSIGDAAPSLFRSEVGYIHTVRATKSREGDMKRGETEGTKGKAQSHANRLH